MVWVKVMSHTLDITPNLSKAVKAARLQYVYAQEQEEKAKTKIANLPVKQQLDDDIKKLKGMIWSKYICSTIRNSLKNYPKNIFCHFYQN